MTHVLRTLTPGLFITALVILGACVPTRNGNLVANNGLVAEAQAKADREQLAALVQEHEKLASLINFEIPSARWGVPRLMQFRQTLDRFEKLQREIAKRDADFAALMEAQEAPKRLASQRNALDEAWRNRR